MDLKRLCFLTLDGSWMHVWYHLFGIKAGTRVMQRAATQAEAAFKRQSAETPREPPRINMTSHCGEAP